MAEDNRFKKRVPLQLFKLFLILLLLAGSALAEEWNDTFKLSVGGMFVTNFQSEVQVSQSGVPIGARINTKQQLGMKSETAVFWMNGYYRFTDTQSMGFTYYNVKSNGSKYVDQIDWGDSNISNAQAQSFFNMAIYELYYDYSFYRNDKVELGLTAGLHVMTFDLGLSADGTVDGVPNSYYSSGHSITAPLPVFGFKGAYYIVPKKLYVSYAAQYFFIKVDQYEGAFVSSNLNLDYRFMEHFGAGVGFSANTLALKATQGGTTVDLTNTLNGVVAYLSYHF
jgi:hypothetical protein